MQLHQDLVRGAAFSTNSPPRRRMSSRRTLLLVWAVHCGQGLRLSRMQQVASDAVRSGCHSMVCGPLVRLRVLSLKFRAPT